MTAEQAWRSHRVYIPFEQGWQIAEDPEKGTLWGWSDGTRLWCKDGRIA